MEEEKQLLFYTQKTLKKTENDCLNAKNEASKKLSSVEQGFPKRVVIIALIVIICLCLGLFMRLVGPPGDSIKSFK